MAKISIMALALALALAFLTLYTLFPTLYTINYKLSTKLWPTPKPKPTLLSIHYKLSTINSIKAKAEANAINYKLVSLQKNASYIGEIYR